MKTEKKKKKNWHIDQYWRNSNSNSVIFHGSAPRFCSVVPKKKNAWSKEQDFGPKKLEPPGRFPAFLISSHVFKPLSYSALSLVNVFFLSFIRLSKEESLPVLLSVARGRTRYVSGRMVSLSVDSFFSWSINLFVCRCCTLH